MLIYLQKEKSGNPLDIAAEYVDEEKGVASVEEAIQGAKDIVAEMISDTAEYRKDIRKLISHEQRQLRWLSTQTRANEVPKHKNKCK